MSLSLPRKGNLVKAQKKAGGENSEVGVGKQGPHPLNTQPFLLPPSGSGLRS